MPKGQGKKTATGTNKPVRPAKDLPKGTKNTTQRKGVKDNVPRGFGGEGSSGGTTHVIR